MTSIQLFLLVVPILGLLLLSINFILAPHNPYKEKSTPFECGYHSFLAQNRLPFTISYFIFGILFLIFDIEIASLFPWIVSSNFNREYGFFIAMLFILVLALGFVYELGKNALKFDSKQNRENITSKPYITTNLENNIFDLISQSDVLTQNIISDISSMSKFIEQLNVFQDKEQFNIVMENDNIGIDTGSEISMEIAQQWAEKVNIFNNLIHLKSHDVEEHIKNLLSIESQIREHSDYSIVEHKFTSSDLQSKFGEARLKFRHWN